MEREPLDWIHWLIIGGIVTGEVAWTYGLRQVIGWLRAHTVAYRDVFLLAAFNVFVLGAILPTIYWICREDFAGLYGLFGVISVSLWFWIGRPLIQEGNERKNTHDVGIRFNEPTL